MASSVVFWIGHYWIVLAEKYHGESTENYAWGLIATSVALGGYLIYRNIKGTNLWYGLGGSLIQIPVLIALSPVAVLMTFSLSVLGASTAEDGKSDRQRRDDKARRYWNYYDDGNSASLNNTTKYWL